MGSVVGEADPNLVRRKLAILLVILLAIAVRIVAFDPYASHHPDEIIQYLEQAHRFAFGRGITTWEYHYGIRNWLVPLLLAGPMRLGEWLAPGTDLYLILPRALYAIVCFASVPAAYAIGRRSSPQHGLVAMAVMGLWYESVFFSVHVLTEPLATASFLSAAALIEPEARSWRFVAAGALLALTAIVRYQFGPAAGVFALIALKRDWRSWSLLVLGAVPVLVGSSVVDLATGMTPFGWTVANLRMNGLAGRAAIFGTEPAFFYVAEILLHWGIAAMAMLLLALLGARRYPALAGAAVANLLVHSLIGHKEYRFVWLSVAILLLLAAIGSVDVVRSSWLRRRIPRSDGWQVTAALIGLWGGLSLALAFSANFAGEWKHLDPASRLTRTAGLAPRICGLATAIPRFWEINYTYAHRDLPLYLVQPGENGSVSRDFTRASGAFNAYLGVPSDDRWTGNYRPVDCLGRGEERRCLFVRPGDCRRSAEADAYEYQATLARNY